MQTTFPANRAPHRNRAAGRLRQAFALWRRQIQALLPVHKLGLFFQTPLLLVRPFDLERTATDQRELARLAWWLRRVYPTSRDAAGYEDTVIRKAWGVHVIPMLFGGMRYATLPIAAPRLAFYDLELGVVFGLSSGRIASTRNIERMTLPAWQRTSYDLAPDEQTRNHCEILAQLVDVVRNEAVTGWNELARRLLLFLTRRMRTPVSAEQA